MRTIKYFLAAFLLSLPMEVTAENPLSTTLPFPMVTKDSWVIIEIWPDVRDITLSAYFLDFSYEKNKNLCEAAKRVFDQNQAVQSKNLGRDMTSYRRCMSVNDAIVHGYIMNK
jgi:hypothetical protein